MNEDLKHYRAKRNAWDFIAAAVLAVIFVGIVGPMDYAEDLDREAEIKLMRAELEALRHQEPRELARIWSARCERLRKQMIATQADGGQWRVRCVDADLSRRTSP